MSGKLEVVIEPSRAWRVFDWRSFVQYRDLLALLVWRDFTSKHRQTVLGPAWFVFQPILTTVVFTAVFAKLTKISTDGMPPILFYLCGLVVWSYFAHSLNSILVSLTANAHLFSKVYFPRLIVPCSILLANLASFGIQLSTFLLFFFYFKLFTPVGQFIHPNMALLLLPVLLLLTAAISLGVGLWVSALTVRYRDIQHVMPLIVQLWMYLTPIIYPSSLLPERYRVWVALNPMATIVEAFRFAFFGSGFLNLGALSISVLLTGGILVSGMLFFQRVEGDFVDTV